MSPTTADAHERAYTDTFNLLGRPLGKGDAVPDAEIDAASSALGCHVPEALRAFYRMAGRARDFIDFHDHFLPPNEWSLEDGKLVFLAENQGVVMWAVDVSAEGDDPAVAMASNEDVLEWQQVFSRCSEFLQFMVIWEGAFGGAMPVTGSAIVEERFRDTLAKSFRPRGELEGASAYSHPGLAVCLCKWIDGWTIFVGAANDEAITPLSDLGVRLEINEPPPIRKR